MLNEMNAQGKRKRDTKSILMAIEVRCPFILISIGSFSFDLSIISMLFVLPGINGSPLLRDIAGSLVLESLSKLRKLRFFARFP